MPTPLAIATRDLTRLYPTQPRKGERGAGVVRALDGELGDRLCTLLDRFELDALRGRAVGLLREGALPAADPGYHSFPWPLV